MRFIYTTKNIETFLLKICISIKTWPVVFRLFGESGSGKTTFLKDFASERHDVLWISCEELKEIICHRINEYEQERILPSYIKYVIIENIEDLKGVEIPFVLSKYVNSLSKLGKTLFITESRVKPISLAVDHKIISVKFIRIKPSRRIIKKIGKKCNTTIDDSEMSLILANFDDLIGLESYIRRLRE